MTAIRKWPRPDVKRVSISGIAIAVETVRNGTQPGQPAIAWLHGLGAASTLTFAATARHEALEGFTSLLIDLPGFGLSDKPRDWSYTIEDHAEVIREVLATVTDRPVTLVGHSMGGAVAIACAGSATGAIQRLIVAEPTHHMEGGAISAHFAAQGESRFVQRGYRALVRVTEREARMGNAASIAWLETLRIASPQGLYRSSVSIRAARSPGFREQFEALALPRSWIGAARSPAVVPPLDESIATRIIPDAGHSMMVDNLDAFAAAVAASMAP
jgi:pimeloyl-ACP methyl ester carboxylesterase